MTQFESNIKIIPYNQEKVYAKISDLSNLEAIKNKIPTNKVSDITFDTDSISFNISPIGNISLRIIEREPYKCVKFGTEKSPIPFNLWIQLVPTSDNECKMKLTIKAEINLFIKGMIQKPLQEGLEKMAEMLSRIPY